MIEKALFGSKKYWILIFSIVTVIAIGFFTYLYQLREGLVVTGMSRDVLGYVGIDGISFIKCCNWLGFP